jgi:hypothetical protein
MSYIMPSHAFDELCLTDAALATFVSETPEAGRPALAERR